MIDTRAESGTAQQRQVEAFFESAAPFWKTLYNQTNLYGTIHQERHALALRWISELGLPQGAAILEIGCGAGLLAADLAGRGYRVTAIDSTEAMVELARAHAVEKGVLGGLTISVGDAHDLPFATASYDLVIALGVVPFLHSPALALAEMTRVVKPAGFVLLNSDNRYRLNRVLDPWFTPVLDPLKQGAKRIARELGYVDRKTPSHFYSYTALERLLANAGLSVTRGTALGFGPFSLFGRHVLPEAVAVRLHRRLQALADRGTPLLHAMGAQHIVLASRAERGPARAVRESPELLMDPGSLAEPAAPAPLAEPSIKGENAPPARRGSAGRTRARATLRRALRDPHSLAILDQLVVSGTRFLTSVIVGRVCGPGELGDYTLGFTMYCLGASILAALMAVPFTAYGNYLHGRERRAYAGSVLAHFAAFEVLAAILLGLSAAGMGLLHARDGLTALTATLAVTLPLAFLVEFARRFAQARLEQGSAVATDLLMSAVQLGGLLAIAALGLLSAVTAFAVVALAGAVAGLTWLALARQQFVLQRMRVLPDALRNWRSGRWTLASQLILVVRSTVVLWLLAFLLGPTSTGTYVASETLVRLSAPLLLAVTSVFFPRVALAYAAGDLAAVRQLARRTASALSAATALLFVLFVAFGEPALAMLYGAAYGAQGAVLSLLALGAVADSLEIVATNGLLALDRSEVNFVANLVGTVMTLTLSALFAPSWGIVGAAWGSLVGRCVTAAVLWVMFWRLSRPQPGRPT
jgi:O-antigen/teichoic acid export membrane protein/2-polyprenyl-3-methyl-5-hydroxy-6-metoxy-1,4-benzoquinol methylase